MAGIRTCDRESQVQRPNHYTTKPPQGQILNSEKYVSTKSFLVIYMPSNHPSTVNIYSHKYVDADSLNYCTLHTSNLFYPIMFKLSPKYSCWLHLREQWILSLSESRKIYTKLKNNQMVFDGKRNVVCKTVTLICKPMTLIISSVSWRWYWVTMRSFTAFPRRGRKCLPQCAFIWQTPCHQTMHCLEH